MKKKRCTGKWTAVRKSRQRSAVDSHYRAGKTERPGSINRKYFSLTSAQDGMPLRGMMVIPAHPRAVLQIAHGMCEHKERYLPFMRYMADRGYLCVIHDHRGMVRADGRRLRQSRYPEKGFLQVSDILVRMEAELWWRICIRSQGSSKSIIRDCLILCWDTAWDHWRCAVI